MNSCEKSNAGSALLFLNFLMLSALTWGSSPIQKAMDALSEKHKLEATRKVCDELRAMQPVYENHISDVFTVGCAYEVANFNAFISSKDDKERNKNFNEWIKEYNDENTKFHEDVHNHCLPGATAYLREGTISEGLISVAMEKLDCTAVYKKTAEDK